MIGRLTILKFLIQHTFILPIEVSITFFVIVASGFTMLGLIVLGFFVSGIYEVVKIFKTSNGHSVWEVTMKNNSLS